MKEPAFWFLARASGFTAYLLITASMIAGLVLKSRPFGAKLKAPIALDVHRFITTLALGGDRRPRAHARRRRDRRDHASETS